MDTELSSSAVASRRGYAGYEYDPTFEGAGRHLYHVRHRVYDADIGRWTRRDPLGYVDGMSLYQYVRSNPLAARDPIGTASRVGGGGLPGSNRPQDPASQCPPGYYYDPIRDQCVQGYRYYVCCRDIKADGPLEWIAKQCAYHCEIRNTPCPSTSPTSPWQEFPIYPDSSCTRKMDDGTPCCNATPDQIAACMQRQRDIRDAAPRDRLFNSCQHYVVWQIGACCLRSTWDPDWAGERPCWRGHYETIRRIRKNGCDGFEWITETVFVCDEYLPDWRDPPGTVPIYSMIRLY
ncbi:MAG: RHS repeat-associated core domain-containing protein [Phycisphaerales bacterium]